MYRHALRVPVSDQVEFDVANDPTHRAYVKVARAWGVSPSKFLGARQVTTHEYSQAGRLVRSVTTAEWTDADRQAALDLEAYEASLCPGCNHPLEETTRPEHSDAYRPEPPIRCHYCTAQAIQSEAVGKQHERSEGLLFSFELNPDVVELNRQPVPPLPPELQ